MGKLFLSYCPFANRTVQCGSQKAGLEPTHLLALGPRASYITCPRLSFLICKVGIIMVLTSVVCCVIGNNACEHTAGTGHRLTHSSATISKAVMKLSNTTVVSPKRENQL